MRRKTRKKTIGYAVASPTAAVPSTGRVFAALEDAIDVLAAAGSARELRVVYGIVAAKRTHDGRVSMTAIELIDRFSRETIFTAWLAALVLATPDVARANAAVARAKLVRFRRHVRDWKDLRITIAQRVVDEARRLRELVPSSQSVTELSARVGDTRTEASLALEHVALAHRDLVAWRFARAVNDGKPHLAQMYRAKLATA